MNSNLQVLICDDSPAVHEALGACFLENNIECTSAFDGEEALIELKKKHFDMLILDLVMPKISGMDVCREIRKSSDVPIIMLTVLGEELERILGIEIGADDYIVKPFSSREVLVRMKNILRRTVPSGRNTKKLFFKEISIDLDRYEMIVLDERLEATPKEIQILYLLAQNEDLVLTREEILSKVWGYEFLGDTRVVDTHVKRLRKKLAGKNVHFSIQTIYGVGYKFVECY